jgi:hypothetical protein
MRTIVFVGIEEERVSPDEISVLFLDCHPSRINPKLWLDALGMRIFIQFLKAHTSTETQMLDCRFNAEFKSLLEQFLVMPEIINAHNVREGLDCLFCAIRFPCPSTFTYFQLLLTH